MLRNYSTKYEISEKNLQTFLENQIKLLIHSTLRPRVYLHIFEAPSIKEVF